MGVARNMTRVSFQGGRIIIVFENLEKGRRWAGFITALRRTL